MCLFRSLRLRRRCWGRRGSWRTPGGNWLRSDSSSTSSCPASCEKTTTEVQPEVHCCVHAEQCEKHTCWMCMYVWIFVSFITAHPLVSHSDFRHSYIHFLPGLLSAADVSRTLGLKKNCYFMFLFSFYFFFHLKHSSFEWCNLNRMWRAEHRQNHSYTHVCPYAAAVKSSQSVHHFFTRINWEFNCNITSQASMIQVKTLILSLLWSHMKERLWFCYFFGQIYCESSGRMNSNHVNAFTSLDDLLP